MVDSKSENSASVNFEVESVRGAQLLPLLIGRNRELAEVDVVLQHRRPALLVVCSEARMDQTRMSLLQVIADRATEQGWRTVGDVRSGIELSVVPTTSDEPFCTKVLRSLGIPTDQAPEPLDKSNGEGFTEALTIDSGEYHFHQLMKELRREPTLLLIDGYRPGPVFAGWFLGRFIEGIKHLEAPVVVVVADRPDNVSVLESSADKLVPLGPPDLQALREHFESIGKRIEPRMKPSEVQYYVEAASKEPENLERLTRVLTWARDSLSAT